MICRKKGGRVSLSLIAGRIPLKSVALDGTAPAVGASQWKRPRARGQAWRSARRTLTATFQTGYAAMACMCDGARRRHVRPRRRHYSGGFFGRGTADVAVAALVGLFRRRVALVPQPLSRKPEEIAAEEPHVWCRLEDNDRYIGLQHHVYCRSALRGRQRRKREETKQKARGRSAERHERTSSSQSRSRSRTPAASRALRCLEVQDKVSCK